MLDGIIHYGGLMRLLKWFKKIRGGADPRFHEDKPTPYKFMILDFGFTI